MLVTKYPELEDEDVQEIDRKMKEPISGETLFEDSVEQIEWNQESVAVQNPYTPAQIVSMAYANIEKCGIYQDDFREWPSKPKLDKTWRSFKARFTRTFKEKRRSYRTSKIEGYVANVQSSKSNTALFTDIQQEHTMAMANLATATQADII